MRITTLLTIPLLAGLLAVPARASAQGSISITFGARLGPEVSVYAYSPERHGNWQANYRRWQPVTLYDINGHYYRSNVRGARPIQVYVSNNEYFFPPQNQGWQGHDRRYRSRWQPQDQDYNRARQWDNRERVDPRLGAEIGVLNYSAERAGDWRRNARRWTPVVLYEVNGRYYPNNFGNARPVSMYRYQNEFFLPPTDQDWVNSDHRFNYNNQPNDEDRNRVRPRP